MIRELLQETFEKMTEKEPHAGFTRKAILLSEEIDEWLRTHGFQESITDKTLRNYYNKATKGEAVTIRSHILNALAEVIGYGNYEVYCKEQSSNEIVPEEIIIKKPTQKKVLWIGGMICILALMGWSMFTTGTEEQRWMKWTEDHYEEVAFTKKAYAAGVLIMYNKEVLESFHKIEPNCKTQFFSVQNEPIIFYGKNHEKEYEYFTMSGNHPLTQKHLRPITGYIIKKYICP